MHRSRAQLGGVPPWHMWGQAKQFTVTSGGVVTTPQTQGQICKVSYKRPETFSFVLAATIIGGQGPGGSPVSPGSLSVEFDVTVGVGLSQVTLKPFTRPFVFQWAGALPLQAQKYTLTAISPVQNDQDATPVTTTSNTVVAENIQVATNCILQTSTNGDQVVVDVQAMFAPRMHVRPDWFGENNGEQFHTEREGR